LWPCRTIQEAKMKTGKACLISALFLFLFNHCWAEEPELLSEIPLEGQIVRGDVLRGKVVLSSAEWFRIASPEGGEALKVELKANQHVVASGDGEFYGIVTYSKDAPPGFLAAEKFGLYSAGGRKLWEIEDVQVGEFFISAGAALIVGISAGEGMPESRLVFYSRSGDLISESAVRLPQGISFSSDGKHLLVNSAREGLLHFDDSGELKANLGKCEQFAVSSDGEHIAAIAEGKLAFHYRGEPMGEKLDLDGIARGMCFSPESRYLALIDRKSLYLFDVQTGKLLWRYVLDQEELSFISLDVARGAEKIITGLDFDKGREVPASERHTKGLAYVFDKKGEITWRKEISYELWSAFFPEVRISEDASRFSIISREKVYLYRSNWTGN
jgi:outer membrane protein assembly factor BamB